MEEDTTKRRPRLAFEDYEVSNLLEGVEKYRDTPQRWRKILSNYHFNPRRTSVDLKDKWRNIVRLDPQKRSASTIYGHKKVPWSNDEIETLRKGYKELDNAKNPWATILEKYRSKFHPVRTSVHLKDKWRNLSRAAKRQRTGDANTASSGALSAPHGSKHPMPKLMPPTGMHQNYSDHSRSALDQAKQARTMSSSSVNKWHSSLQTVTEETAEQVAANRMNSMSVDEEMAQRQHQSAAKSYVTSTATSAALKQARQGTPTFNNVIQQTTHHHQQQQQQQQQQQIPSVNSQQHHVNNHPSTKQWQHQISGSSAAVKSEGGPIQQKLQQEHFATSTSTDMINHQATPSVAATSKQSAAATTRTKQVPSDDHMEVVLDTTDKVNDEQGNEVDEVVNESHTEGDVIHEEEEVVYEVDGDVEFEEGDEIHDYETGEDGRVYRVIHRIVKNGDQMEIIRDRAESVDESEIPEEVRNAQNLEHEDDEVVEEVVEVVEEVIESDENGRTVQEYVTQEQHLVNDIGHQQDEIHESEQQLDHQV